MAIDRMGPKGDVAVNRDVRQAQAIVRGLSGEADVDLTFPPIRDSAGQRYRLRAVVPVMVDGTLALTANHDNTYPLGSLYVSGREQPGDLVFDAYSSIATSGELLEAAIAGRPRSISALPAARALSTVTASTLATISSSGTGRP